MTQALTGGFTDPARDAARAFRPILTAMARPGEIHGVSGATAPGLSAAAATVVATLCDPTTPLFLAPSLDSPALRDWIAFHTGAPLSDPAGATFALGPWEDLPLEAFPIGTPEYPDRSATLIVETATLSPDGAMLRGPGIREANRLSLPDVAAVQANAALFPLGLDFLFTCGDRIAALPRSTKVS